MTFQTRNLPWGPVQDRFVQHSAFRKKSATTKNTNFALDAYDRFMNPSWVRAYGLISRVYHIVWFRAPRYRRLSSPRGRIRENSASKFGPNFVTHSSGIFFRWYFLIQFTQYRHPAPRRGEPWVASAWPDLVSAGYGGSAGEFLEATTPCKS